MWCTGQGVSYGFIGNADGTTTAGVNYPGVAFLLRQPFPRLATVFAFKASYRNLHPVRFQIWRPSSTTPGNSYQLITEVVHQSELEPGTLPALERVSMTVQRETIVPLR